MLDKKEIAPLETADLKLIMGNYQNIRDFCIILQQQQDSVSSMQHDMLLKLDAIHTKQTEIAGILERVALNIESHNKTIEESTDTHNRNMESLLKDFNSKIDDSTKSINDFKLSETTNHTELKGKIKVVTIIISSIILPLIAFVAVVWEKSGILNNILSNIQAIMNYFYIH